MGSQSQEISRLESRLSSCQSECDGQKRQIWEAEKARADLAAQVEKLQADGEFMEGEMAGLRESGARLGEQVSDGTRARGEGPGTGSTQHMHS